MPKFPEAFSIGQHYRLHKLHEFDLDFDRFPLGALVMWEPPMPGASYTIGVDPSWGIGQDKCAIHVLRNGTLKQKDAQVAEFAADDLNPHDLTPICYMLGNLYNNTVEGTEALMSIECNLTDSTIYELRNTYQYSNLFIWKSYDNINNVWTNKLGWWTTARTRPKIIVKAVHYINQQWWDVPSPWLLGEMQTIQKAKDKERVEAATGFNDDLFMAAAIALWSAHDTEFNTEGFEEVAKSRERQLTTAIEAMTAHQREPVGPKRKDFQNTACSSDDMENYDPQEIF